MSIQPLAFYGEEKISRLNGSRIYGISLSYDIAIVAPRCGYEFSNSRERQLHGFFPAVAVAASQSYPASRRTCCATCTSSKGIGPSRITCIFSWPCQRSSLCPPDWLYESRKLWPLCDPAP